MLITIEGIDGTGKTTLVKKLRQVLTKTKLRPSFFREPGGTVFSEDCRKLLISKTHSGNIVSNAQLFLILAARCQLVHEQIIPILSQGKNIIMDRYIHSTLAYQGYGNGLDITKLMGIMDFVNLPRPSLVILLDASQSDISSRVKDEKPDVFESLSSEYFEKVRNGYLELSSQPDPLTKWCVIDATQNPRTVLLLAIKAIVEAGGE